MGSWGVGMPASLWLEQFGDHLWAAFGETAYMVGSATRTSEPRDVDVRVMLSDEDWARTFPRLPPGSDEGQWHRDAKWVAVTLAFSELGRRITGLPIDFQVPAGELRERAVPADGGARAEPDRTGPTPLRGGDVRWGLW